MREGKAVYRAERIPLCSNSRRVRSAKDFMSKMRIEDKKENRQ
jgi:hypothetical protein